MGIPMSLFRQILSPAELENLDGETLDSSLQTRDSHHKVACDAQDLEKTEPNLDPISKVKKYVTTMSGWWLGHPSEKYERQLG